MGSYGLPEPVTGIFGKALARGCAQKPLLLTLSLTHPPNTPVPWEAKESKRSARRLTLENQRSRLNIQFLLNVEHTTLNA